MEKLVINSFEEFASHEGQQLGISDWLQVDQDRINQFADATLDHQWIHVDVERAKRESPYKSTIAHGYLTLSLLPHLWGQIIEVNHLKMMVNYGMDKMTQCQARQDRKPARHLQGLYRFQDRDRGSAQACTAGRGSVPLLF